MAFHGGSRVGGTPSPPTTPSNWQNTVVMIHRPTKPGQYIFILGGTTQNGQCASSPETQPTDKCAIQIAHTSNASFIYAEYLMWSQGDNYLDFEGEEKFQGTHDGTTAQGTPTFWTTSDSSAPEYQPYNKYGDDYWFVQFKMDCSQTKDGWFEFKAYENQGVGWEPDINQGSCGSAGSAPFTSNNHIGKCGFVNVYQWGSNSCTITNT